MTGLLHDLEEAESLVEDIDDDVVDKRGIKGETNDGISIEGHACNHGGHKYLVLASEHWDYLIVKCGFNLDEVIAIETKSKQIQNINEETEIELTEEDLQNARKKLDNQLDNVDNSTLRSVRLSLIKNLAIGDAEVEIDRSEGAKIHGFNVDKRIYRNDDSFDEGEFFSTVQKCVNLAWYSKEYLGETYGLADFMTESQNSTRPPDTHSFQ